MIKIDAFERVANIALEEIIYTKGLPKDESASLSPKDFLSLLHQYTRSHLSKSETKNLLVDILDKPMEKYNNRTLKEVLTEHIDVSQIIKEAKPKNKIGLR